MSSLITVPSLLVKNGEQRPIKVNYYTGSIELQQFGEYDEPESIIIDTDSAKQVFAQIIKHIPEAKEWLER